jgi:hypothetical protein
MEIGGSPPGRDAPVPAAVVHAGGRTRVTRLFLPGQTVVRKELFGADAPGRLRHEIAMLQRLRGVVGVVQVLEAPRYPGSIVLEDVGGTSLAGLCTPLDGGQGTTVPRRRSSRYISIGTVGCPRRSSSTRTVSGPRPVCDPLPDVVLQGHHALVDPRRMSWSVSSPNQRSTWLIHEDPVGVKCM